MTNMFRYLDPRHLVRRRLAGRKPPRWDAAILCFRDAPGSRDMMRILNPRRIGHRILYSRGQISDRGDLRETSIAGRRIGIVGEVEWGGPQSAIFVEELAALRVPRIFGLGCCGGLDPGLERGSQVAAIDAPATDGTSRWYGGGIGRADAGLLRTATKAAGRLDISLPHVRAITMDALFRETPAAVRRWRRIGGQIVNMESAPFYLAAKACGVKALWLGHVSDRLLPGKWDAWHHGRENMTTMTARLCRATIEAL